MDIPGAQDTAGKATQPLELAWVLWCKVKLQLGMAESGFLCLQSDFLGM